VATSKIYHRSRLSLLKPGASYCSPPIKVPITSKTSVQLGKTEEYEEARLSLFDLYLGVRPLTDAHRVYGPCLLNQ